MANAKVRYKGMSDVRVLPADQLAERGVKGIDKDLVFSAQNMWSQEVPMSGELEAVLRGDGAFAIEPVKDDGSTDADNPEADALGEDDTADTVVMEDTGQIDKATTTDGQ